MMATEEKGVTFCPDCGSDDGRHPMNCPALVAVIVERCKDPEPVPMLEEAKTPDNLRKRFRHVHIAADQQQPFSPARRGIVKRILARLFG